MGDAIDTDAIRTALADAAAIGRPVLDADTITVLCDEVDRLRVQNERLTLLATDRGEQLKKCAGKLAEQRTLISEVALEREQALAEAHRLRGEWEDAIANNEGVWEEGFHKGREYQREAERRG